MAEKITGEIHIKKERFGEIKEKVNNLLNFKKEIEENASKSATEVLEIILGGAIALGASDIHIEPLEKQAKARIRTDGILHDVLLFDIKPYNQLRSRIKLLSGLKLNIVKSPQDGRFSIFFPQEIEIRTSTLPSEYGESIVLRILNPESLIELEQLGLRPYILETFKKEVKKPNGMIIVTGPTGSGKTTTLYAVLKKIRKPEIKIITIEDPIEYHLGGISQTQVNAKAGYSFASGLASMMRQDPDVILVGEIRDTATVKIALQAALTGHLVLSTLHTNDAAGAIPRLVNLEAEPDTIAAALNMVVAQRLVRKVCEKCAKFRKISQEEIKNFTKTLEKIPENIEIPFIDQNLKIPEAVGCEMCNNTGYRGRKGIFEIFLVDEEIQNLILTKAPVFEIKKMAIKRNMIPMYQAGLIEVILGTTTLAEVERVIGEK